MNINRIGHFAKPLRAVVIAAGLAAGVGLVCSQATKTKNTEKADWQKASIVNPQKNSNEQIVIELPYELQTPTSIDIGGKNPAGDEATFKSLDSVIDGVCGKGFSAKVKSKIGWL